MRHNGDTGDTTANLFAGFCAGIVRRLPFGLATVIAPNFVGFALINGFTFSVDLALLTLGRGVLGLPLPIAVTAGYLGGFGLSFVLNRVFNFRSHAPVSGQALRYAIAVGVNYLAFILGASSGLAALGLEYHLSRVLAGTGEAVFMYCVLRWFVFGGSRTAPTEGTRSTRLVRRQPR
ncbi:GtrA family protein [Amycolatopsis cynarae]|uniref:GtrA family protein n=1 Tax=Amycolatopsis cynarae TaxID=2995223 RepID=A0ABY7AYG9_9PSEU|nr:GtrA family protein [Amycolatopsis sp. HUAS 11-8]WAL63706.1 GtrA family protein [Amycolatopsis sp. HUAS 11-8]